LPNSAFRRETFFKLSGVFVHEPGGDPGEEEGAAEGRGPPPRGGFFSWCFFSADGDGDGDRDEISSSGLFATAGRNDDDDDETIGSFQRRE